MIFFHYAWNKTNYITNKSDMKSGFTNISDYIIGDWEEGFALNPHLEQTK